MQKNKPQQGVINVAKAVLKLAALGAKPSKRKIIAITGGSFSSKWFIEAFDVVKEVSDDFTDINNIKKTYKLTQPKNEASKNIGRIAQQASQIESLEKYIFELEQKKDLVTEKCAKLEHNNSHLSILLKKIEHEREKILNDIRQEKDEQIRSLIEELAKTHKEHGEKFRSHSFTTDERLIQKEVENINLKEKLAARNKTIEDLQAKLMPWQKNIKKLKEENKRLTRELYVKDKVE
jgi:chromosome segregation ATPase